MIDLKISFGQLVIGLMVLFFNSLIYFCHEYGLPTMGGLLTLSAMAYRVKNSTFWKWLLVPAILAGLLWLVPLPGRT